MSTLSGVMDTLHRLGIAVRDVQVESPTFVNYRGYSTDQGQAVTMSITFRDSDAVSHFASEMKATIDNATTEERLHKEHPQLKELHKEYNIMLKLYGG